MKPHPQAEILRAIADGKTVQILNKNIPSSLWQDIDEHETLGFILEGRREGRSYELRIKPETININGHELPAPVREPLEVGTPYWQPLIGSSKLEAAWVWRAHEVDTFLLKRGLIQLTKEAAIAHAEALLSFTRSDK